ncbi:unnamed protein product [Thlaspi arvense]|uniref:Uncharacterized protein n=1 Tax=Thlaspi arvense TaxID=13288 RepID=A0AAU9T503_THLAR|nr:unnamed protein product [Thlaspi arvense]
MIFDTTIARHYVHIKDLHELSSLNNSGSFFVLRFRRLAFRYNYDIIMWLLCVHAANSPHFSKRVCGSQCTSNYGPQKCYQDCVNPPKGFLRYTFVKIRALCNEISKQFNQIYISVILQKTYSNYAELTTN